MNAEQENELFQTVGRIEGKLDFVIDNHGGRLTVLETRRGRKKAAWWTGIVATLTSLIGYVLSARQR